MLLTLDYAGESMDIFLDGKKINDYFYTGQPALLSLGYFGFPSVLTARVHPLCQGDPVFLERWPSLENGRACRIEGARVRLNLR